MTKIMIDRDLLERIRELMHIIAHRQDDYGVEAEYLGSLLKKVIAHPTQQGEAVEVAPDGYVVVPVEPTPEMAAQTAYDGKQYSDPFDFDDFRKDYAAMLAAAPAPAPAPAQGQQVECQECERLESLIKQYARRMCAAEDELAAFKAHQVERWIPVTERLPSRCQPVLACYTNCYGRGRTIRAQWLAKFQQESDDIDNFYAEYDEETDTYYDPEGWYELIDNWDEYSSVAVTEGIITHWMPLPAAPALAASTGQEVG